MAHDEPPHQDLSCLQIQLFSSLVLKELIAGFLSVYTLGKTQKLIAMKVNWFTVNCLDPQLCGRLHTWWVICLLMEGFHFDDILGVI